MHIELFVDALVLIAFSVNVCRVEEIDEWYRIVYSTFQIVYKSACLLTTQVHKKLSKKIIPDLEISQRPSKDDIDSVFSFEAPCNESLNKH